MCLTNLQEVDGPAIGRKERLKWGLGIGIILYDAHDWGVDLIESDY